ncbi:hypothetical protein D082_23510 [Synechocystis sp. PCC 6714]|nr:hypothetical protein D082_23510 [Synechocystis sp. PCC 6714]
MSLVWGMQAIVALVPNGAVKLVGLDNSQRNNQQLHPKD